MSPIFGHACAPAPTFFFYCMRLVVRTMESEQTQKEICVQCDGEAEQEKQISVLLSDSDLRDLLNQRLTKGGHVAKQHTSTENNSGGATSRNPFGGGGWPAFPVHFPFVPFPTTPSTLHPTHGRWSQPIPPQFRIWVGPHVGRARRR